MGLAAAFANTAVPPAAHAADSIRPIRLIVPTPPGSASDALARAMAAAWGRYANRPVVVENIAGAGGTIGTSQLVRSAKDGLTLGLISSNHTINPWLYKKLPYDTLTDIAPISMIGNVPALLVANPSVAANTVADLVRLSKSAKVPLSEGIVSGTAYQMASEVFKDQAGISSNRIAYKGSAPILTDLLGGTLDYAFVAAQAAAPHIAAGKLKGLAVSTAVRTEMAPQVPTLAESGYPKYSVDVWIALAGPAGISAAELAARRKEIELTLADVEVKKAFQLQGLQPIQIKPNEWLSFLKRELERNRAVVQKVGITID